MGLMIHSLGEFPIEAQRGYYVYLLDYGWKDEIGQTLRNNFDRMAQLASLSDAAVIKGTVGSHFEDDVLSWHRVNGQSSEGLLPAILITTRNPHTFRSEQTQCRSVGHVADDNMIIVPLNRVCNTSTDVTQLIERIFTDIGSKKALTDFEVVSTMKAGKGGAIVDALILQPNVAGIGINVNNIIDFFRKKHKE